MYTEKEAAKIMKQLLKGINYCHEKKICHRDIKPENLLLLKEDEIDSIKIIDFGLSKDFGKKREMSKKVGTAYYVAPEVLRGNYNPLCDVWSAGIILYILLSGDPPFNGRSDHEIYSKIDNGKYEFPEKRWSKISTEAKDLIKHMLCKQEDRLTAAEALNHEWFKLCETKQFEQIDFNIEGFQKYVKEKDFKKIILNYIADRLNEEDIVKLKEMFLKLDTEHLGSISLESFRTGLKGYNLEDSEVEDIFKNIDIGQDGVIDYSEFLAAAIDIKKDIREVYLYDAFLAFDTNHDNVISKEDFMAILKAEEGDKIMLTIDDWIKSADKNGDGKIDYNEFLEFFLKDNEDSK